MKKNDPLAFRIPGDLKKIFNGSQLGKPEACLRFVNYF